MRVQGVCSFQEKLLHESNVVGRSAIRLIRVITCLLLDKSWALGMGNVLTNLYCQLDWVGNLLGDALWVCVCEGFGAPQEMHVSVRGLEPPRRCMCL